MIGSRVFIVKERDERSNFAEFVGAMVAKYADEVDLVKSHFVTSREVQDDNLKSQIVTSSWGGKRKLPYAFTEQGIYMLATVLKGELATKGIISSRWKSCMKRGNRLVH